MKADKDCVALGKSLGAKFLLKDRDIPLEEVFADTGLLPAIAKRADQLSSLCLGYGIGAVFKDNDKSMLSMSVEFDEMTPQLLRMLCILDVVIELMQSGAKGDKTILDELLYD